MVAVALGGIGAVVVGVESGARLVVARRPLIVAAAAGVGIGVVAVASLGVRLGPGQLESVELSPHQEPLSSVRPRRSRLGSRTVACRTLSAAVAG